jgi:carbamoyltransferase
MEMRFPHSLGLLYSAFTYFLGFKVNSGEYKLMGMAPYGNPNSLRIKEYRDKILTHMLDIKADGSIWMNQDYFQYATGLRMIDDKRWEDLFGFKARSAESHIEQHHCDLAYVVQQLHDDIILKMAAEAKKLTGAKHLCLAGGSALNCVSNGKLLKEGIFESIWIHRQRVMPEERLVRRLRCIINILGQNVRPAIIITIKCREPILALNSAIATRNLQPVNSRRCFTG